MRARVIFALACLCHAGAMFGATGALTYSTYLGGDSTDTISAMVLDSAGNVYLSGDTLSSNFPVTAGAYQTKNAGPTGTNSFEIGTAPQPMPDAFVVKLNPQGQIVWGTYLGGSGYDSANAIAVDAAGSVYVAGITSSPNFPVTTGTLRSVPAGSADAFVAKLSADGSKLLYSELMGGTGATSINAIAVDGSGNAYLGGEAASDFPVTANAYRTQGSGAFVVKVSADGSSIVYSSFLGDNGSGAVTTVAVDSAGDLYAGGLTNVIGFPTTPGAVQSTVAAGHSGAFLVKLNPSGTSALYSMILGGDSDTAGERVAIDSGGNAYFTGSTSASNFPVTQGAFQKTPSGGGDVFAVKIAPDGSSLIYSTLIGGGAADTVAGLAVDGNGDAFLAGKTLSTDFPVSADALPKRFAGSPCELTAGLFGDLFPACPDVFAAELDPAGHSLIYSTYLSGSNADSASAAAVDGAGAFYIAGSTESDNFPVAGTPVSDSRYPATCTTSSGGIVAQINPCDDGFLAKIEFNGPLPAPPLLVANFGDLFPTPVAPAEVVVLYGAGIGPSSPATLQLDSNNQITTILAGTQVLFDGVAAPLIRVDTNQISAIVPNTVAGKKHSTVSVMRGGAVVASETVVVGVASPALLTLDPSGTGQCAAVNLDGTLNTPDSPAASGSIVSLYGIGMGATGQPDGALATAAKQNFAVGQIVVGNLTPAQTFYPSAIQLYAGASPGMTDALTQINIQLPKGLTGQVPVYVLAGGSSTQYGAVISVR